MDILHGSSPLPIQVNSNTTETVRLRGIEPLNSRSATPPTKPSGYGWSTAKFSDSSRVLEPWRQNHAINHMDDPITGFDIDTNYIGIVDLYLSPRDAQHHWTASNGHDLTGLELTRS
jgi:hypothetical protein